MPNKNILILLLAILLGSCISMNQLIEAEALGKGNQSLQFNAETTVIVDPDDTGGIWPVIGVQYGYGITNSLDIRAELSTNRNIRLSAKTTLVDREKWDFSIGGTLDSDILFARSLHPSVQAFYSYDFGNSILMLNPSAEYTTNVFFTGRETSGTFYSLTLGMAMKNENPFKFGLNIGYGPQADISPIFGLGAAYEFNWTK